MTQKDKYLYKYPYDEKICLKHRKAARIFKKYSNKLDYEKCDCCNKKVGDEKNQPKSIWFNPLELAVIGPGLPLFFCFVKNAVFLIFFFLIIYAAFSLYSDKLSGGCQQFISCRDATIDSYTILNSFKNIFTLQLQMIFMLTFTCFSIIIFQFLRNEIQRLNDKCDFLIDSPSDYSIIIRRLPQNITQSDIIQMINKLRQTLTPQDKHRTKNMEVNHVVLSYSMESYRKLKQKNMERFKECIKKNKPEQFKQQYFQGFNQSGDVCIVVFERQQAKQYFSFQPTIKQKLLQCLWSPCIPESHFQVKGQKVFIERAPEPDDIIWQNASVEINEAVKRKTIFNILGFGLLILGCGVQYSLALAQQRVSQSAKFYLSLISSLLISLSNYGILQFLIFASSQQRNLTHTEYNSALMVKISYLQFLNAGIFLLISKSLAASNNFKVTDTLVFEINTIMILNALSHTISVFVLDYFEIVNKVMLYLGKLGCLKFSQAQANQLYQSTLPEMPYKYGYVIKTLWLTAFYSSFAPLSALYSLIGLIINYYAQKKLFACIYSAPQMFSSVLNSKAVQLMEFFPLTMTLGALVIIIDYESQLSGKLHKMLFNVEKDPLVYFEVYNQVENRFQMTYEMTNPAYHHMKRKRAIINCDGKIKKRVLIGDTHEIYLTFDEIANNSYKTRIQKAIYQVNCQKLRNEQKIIRYHEQKKEEARDDDNFYEILIKQQLEKSSDMKDLLNEGMNWKQKMRLMQIYNPLRTSDRETHKYRERNFKNLMNDKDRLDNLFDHYFQKFTSQKEEKQQNEYGQTVPGEREQQQLQRHQQQRQNVRDKSEDIQGRCIDNEDEIRYRPYKIIQ